MGTNKNRPDFRDPDVRDQLEAVTLSRDVFAGTLNLRKKATEYLPRFPREPEKYYRTRLQSAVLYNALRRTVRGLAGIVFQRDPVLTDKVPKEIRDYATNIDLAGRNFASFSHDIYDDSLLDGHHIIFVDTPLKNDQATSREDEQGMRPYWKGIRKDQVLRQRWALIDYEMRLIRFAYIETQMEADGAFGLEEVRYVREYSLLKLPDTNVHEVVFTHYRENRQLDERWQIVDQRTLVGIDKIPAVYHYTDRTSLGISTPPLLDLAAENVAHYQLTSDRRNSLHIAGVPIPVFSGIEEGVGLEVASNKGIRLNEGGAATYLEPEGKALEQSRAEIRDSEARMAALGLAMLQRDTRAAETAEARRIEKSETDSSLTKSAKSMRLALEDALVLTAKWKDIDLDPEGLVDVHTDFDKQAVTPEQIRVMSQMVKEGQLSIRTMWDTLRAGKVLPEDFDADEEIKRMEEEEEMLMDRFAPEPTPNQPPQPIPGQEPGRDPGASDE